MKLTRTFNAARLVAAIDPADFESMDSECPGFWTYSGDVSLEYGGTFFKLDPADLQYGYCSAIRVTDLASACGFDGAVMIERITILGLDDKARISSALDCCGWLDESADISFASAIMQAADGLLGYGYYDPDSDPWTPATRVFQMERDGALEFDGWRAERWTSRRDLRAWILAEMLD